jgi:hypothetical protein
VEIASAPFTRRASSKALSTASESSVALVESEGASHLFQIVH